jgi:hypothetical protein
MPLIVLRSSDLFLPTLVVVARNSEYTPIDLQSSLRTSSLPLQKVIGKANIYSFEMSSIQKMRMIWKRLMKLYDAMAKWVLDLILVNGENENNEEDA